jgi:hypothetical protein
MKTSLLTLLLIVMFCIACLQSCEVLAEGDECEGSSMDMVEPVIYIRAYFDMEARVLAPDANLMNAEKMIITGSIQKEYCSGKLSGYFTYNTTFYLSEMSYDDHLYGFYFPQPYQYKFSNLEDELIVIMRIKVYTADGRIFESEEIIDKFKYADIKFDANMFRYYITVVVPGIIRWVRVTS